MRRSGFLVALLILASSIAGEVGARPSPTPRIEAQQVEAEYRRLVGELMSPFCQGLTLENCPTTGAAEMREQIRVWLLEGRPADEIVDALAEEWGEGILGVPRFRGLGVLAWTLPGVALVLAGLTLIRWLRRQASSESPPAMAETERLAEIRIRVERDLAALGD